MPLGLELFPRLWYTVRKYKMPEYAKAAGRPANALRTLAIIVTPLGYARYRFLVLLINNIALSLTKLPPGGKLAEIFDF